MPPPPPPTSDAAPTRAPAHHSGKVTRDMLCLIYSNIALFLPLRVTHSYIVAYLANRLDGHSPSHVVCDLLVFSSSMKSAPVFEWTAWSASIFQRDLLSRKCSFPHGNCLHSFVFDACYYRLCIHTSLYMYEHRMESYILSTRCECFVSSLLSSIQNSLQPIFYHFAELYLAYLWCLVLHVVNL